MKYITSIVFCIFIVSAQVRAGGLGNFLKQLDSSVNAQNGNAESSDDPSLINKKELKSTMVLDDNGPYVLLKLDFTNANDEYKSILLSYVKDGDRCIGTSSVKDSNDLSSDKSWVTDLKPDQGNELRDSFCQYVLEQRGKYTVATMMRPDGSCYKLSSGYGFLFSGCTAIPVNTAKGDRYMPILKAKIEAAASAAEQAKSNAASAAKATEDAFQSYIKPTDIEAASYQKLLNDAKSRGDLVFKNFFLGMPLSYLASINGISLVRLKTEHLIFDEPVKPGDTVSKIAVKMGDSILYKIEFTEKNAFAVKDGVFYAGVKPIKELSVDNITLDRAALESLFGVAELDSLEIVKKFCKAYKISVPNLWIPEYGDEKYNPGDVKSVYKLRDPKGFRLTFTCYQKERNCELLLEKIQTDKDIDKSFN